MTARDLTILELATAHVGAGKLTDEDMQRLTELDDLLGDECRFQGGPLWRVISIDECQAAELRAGRPTSVPVRTYSCWSRDPASLMNIARHRFSAMSPEQSLLMIRAEIPTDRLGVDMEEVFRSRSFTQDASWTLYAGREREVVLRHDEPLMVVTADMVEGLWLSGEYEAIAPRTGETFLGPDEDLVVEDVSGPENGGWVVSSSGQNYLLHWEFGALTGMIHKPDPDPLPFQ